MTTVIKPEAGLQAITQAELNKNLKKALSTIDKKLRDLGVAEAVLFRASPNFKYNEMDGNTINIQSCVDLNYLIKALALMKQVQRNFDEVCLDLKLKVAPPVWYSSPVDAWIHDLTLRIKLVANVTQINELQKAKTELTTFLSTEDRLQATLVKVRDLL